MIRITTRICILLSACANSLASSGDTSAACKRIEAEKKPTLFLIDRNGELSDGPLDVGKLEAPSATIADQILYPTSYRIVVTPSRLRLTDTCTQGRCLKLTRISPHCRNTATYSVQLGLSFLKPGGRRPYPLTSDGQLGGFIFEDPKGSREEDIGQRFKATISGELVELLRN